MLHNSTAPKWQQQRIHAIYIGLLAFMVMLVLFVLQQIPAYAEPFSKPHTHGKSASLIRVMSMCYLDTPTVYEKGTHTNAYICMYRIQVNSSVVVSTCTW